MRGNASVQSPRRYAAANGQKPSFILVANEGQEQAYSRKSASILIDDVRAQPRSFSVVLDIAYIPFISIYISHIRGDEQGCQASHKVDPVDQVKLASQKREFCWKREFVDIRHVMDAPCASSTRAPSIDRSRDMSCFDSISPHLISKYQRLEPQTLERGKQFVPLCHAPINMGV
jgi:hypothetical protein